MVSVYECLPTVYEPECDYVDAVLEDRNVGQWGHSRLLIAIGSLLKALEKMLGIWVLPDQRVQVKPTRFRVPDLCVVVGPKPQEQILTRPPFLCVEILSPGRPHEPCPAAHRRFPRDGRRRRLGPELRKGWVFTAQGAREAKDGALRTSNPDIEVKLAELFAEL